MKEVRKKARYYISNGIIKTEGIKKLKREFKIPERTILIIWLEEKENLENKVNRKTSRNVKAIKTKNDTKTSVRNDIKQGACSGMIREERYLYFTGGT